MLNKENFVLMIQIGALFGSALPYCACCLQKRRT